jgi:opacity protein-like surface antigen
MIICMHRNIVALIFLPLLAAVSTNAWAAELAEGAVEVQEYQAPRWGVAFKVGRFEPDLDRYKEFYGGDAVTYFSLEGAVRLTNWLELGLEGGYSKDEGTGFLPSAGIPGGSVDYTVMPAQLFLNFRYEQSGSQWLVPYAGAGLAVAWYKQDIDQQPTVEGRTDLGYGARAGVELLLNHLDRRGAEYLRNGRRLKTYLFVEGQVYSAKIDGIDVGGNLYLLGLRFDFDG